MGVVVGELLLFISIAKLETHTESVFCCLEVAVFLVSVSEFKAWFLFMEIKETKSSILSSLVVFPSYVAFQVWHSKVVGENH